MRIRIKSRFRSAFTLIEVAMTTAILGIVFTGFYAGIGSGFATIGLTRENLRANQILLEKMETIRLYSWDQISSNGFITPTFSAQFYPPVGGLSNTSPGITYHGRIAVTPPPFDAIYSNNVKLVTVSITWTNGNNPRTRSMQTLVSEFGMQTYIY